MTLKEQIVAEIMTLVRPQPQRRPDITVAELEKILNSETTDAVNIEPDGSVTVTPTVTTVGAVAEKVVAVVQAAFPEWRPMDGSPKDETVFLGALLHDKGVRPRWEYALLWWTEGRLRFYEAETGWEPDEYTHWMPISEPLPFSQ